MKNKVIAYKLHVSMISIIGMSLSTVQTFCLTLYESPVSITAIISEMKVIMRPDIKKPPCWSSYSYKHNAV